MVRLARKGARQQIKERKENRKQEGTLCKQPAEVARQQCWGFKALPRKDWGGNDKMVSEQAAFSLLFRISISFINGIIHKIRYEFQYSNYSQKQEG